MGRRRAEFDDDVGRRPAVRRRVVGRLSLGVLVMLAACSSPDGDLSIRSPDERELASADDFDPELDRGRAPISLWSRDGAVLPLRSLEIRGEIEGPLAFTELHLEFENAESRDAEAVLELMLPDRAKLARFAIEDDGAWRDAGIVARAATSPRAGLRAKTPPSIDYGESGQLVRVMLPRVARRDRTRVIVAYREELRDVRDPYRVHLAGLPELEQFKARVRGGIGADRDEGPKEGRVGTDGVDIERRSWVPDHDLVLRSPRHRDVAVHRDGLVAARIRPLTHDHHDEFDSLTILFDTSASRAPRFDESVTRVAAIVDEVARWRGPETRVHLVAFDQGHETIYEGPVGAINPTHFDTLRRREAMGASDLGAALRYVGHRPGHRYDRILLVTDGVVTAGVRDLERLGKTVEGLGRRGLRRLDVLADGGLRDQSTLRRLTRTLARPGMLLDPRESDRRLVHRMTRSVVTDVRIDVPGATWSHPGRVEGIQSGDELIVYAEYPEPLEGDAMTVDVGGEIEAIHRVPLEETARPLLETALAEAHVEDLSNALLDSGGQVLAVRRKVYDQIVALSRRHRLLNDYTRFDMAGDVVPEPMLVMGPRHTELRQSLPLVGSNAPLHFPTRYLTVDRLALVLSFEADRAARRDGVGVDRPGDASSSSGAAESASRPVASMTSTVASTERDEVAAIDPVETAPAGVPIATTRPTELVADLRHELQRDVWSTPDSRRPEVLREPSTSWAGTGVGASGSAPSRDPSDAHRGNLLAVMNLIAWGEAEQATTFARAWRARDPGDPLAFVALGESYEVARTPEKAVRAYGSLIDLYPDRPDVRRFAGSRLEGLDEDGSDLAIDTFRRALDLHPDNPASHRALAFALVRRGRYERAFEVLEGGLARTYELARHDRARDGLRRDLGILGAAWLRSEPNRRVEVVERLAALGARLELEPSVQVTLTWETPDSDVDLHVRDSVGHHAYHESPRLPDGGHLVEDVAGGFGMERFIVGAGAKAPYDLQVHYYARGPLGYGMGTVEIMRYDGHGGLAFELRPFVVTRDRAYLDMGILEVEAGETPAPRHESPPAPPPVAVVESRRRRGRAG